MTDAVHSKFHAMLDATINLVRLDWVAIILVILVQALIETSLAFLDDLAEILMIYLTGLIAMMIILLRALAKAGWSGDPNGLHMVRLFGLALLTQLAICVGIILLLLPGVFLGLRWFMSWPILVERGETIVGAMRESWKAMREWELSVFGLSFLIYLPTLIICIPIYWTYSEPPFSLALTGSVLSVASYVLVTVQSVATWEVIKGWPAAAAAARA